MTTSEMILGKQAAAAAANAAAAGGGLSSVSVTELKA